MHTLTETRKQKNIKPCTQQHTYTHTYARREISKQFNNRIIIKIIDDKQKWKINNSDIEIKRKPTQKWIKSMTVEQQQ